jgi:hypothetical protein
MMSPDRRHQAVVCAEKEPHLKAGLAVDVGQSHTLDDVVRAVVALHHGDEMFPLQSPRVRRFSVLKERRTILRSSEMVEEQCDVVICARRDEAR